MTRWVAACRAASACRTAANCGSTSRASRLPALRLRGITNAQRAKQRRACGLPLRKRHDAPCHA